MDLLHYPLAFIAVLGVLVTFHEFGHYIVARWSGVGILRFSVGFGRPLLSRTDRHGTEFTLAMIPLGGYVRMYDERDHLPGQETEVEVPPGTVSFMDLHPAWRIAISLGGPVANFILAIVVYWVLALAGSTNITPMVAPAEAGSPAALAGFERPVQILSVDGRSANGWQDIGLSLTDRLGESGAITFTVRDLQTHRVSDIDVPIYSWHEGVGEPDVIGSLGLQPVVLSLVGELVEDSPAVQAGLQPGDFIVAVNGVPVLSWADWAGQIEAHPNERVVIELYRDGRLMQLSATPGSRMLSDGREVGSIGVYQPQIAVSHGVVAAMGVAVAQTWDKTVLILSVVKKMITGHVSVKNLSGPISIAQVAGDSAKYSWRSFVGILAFLSVSLGVFNLLPIPILDGGHVVMHTAELITGKPIPENIQVLGVQVGLFLVGTMVIFATYNDLLRLF
ncbi:MAG: RIP metalloprotease RseP [bacterium]